MISRSSARFAMIIVLVLWGMMTHGTFAGTGDEPHYELITHSLAFDHDLDLGNNYTDPDNLALGGRIEPGLHVRPGRNGRISPVHDVGMPIVFTWYYGAAYLLTEQIVTRVPAAWLRRARLNFTVLLRHLLSLAMIAVTAGIGVTLRIGFARLTSTPARAGVWAALLVLSPPILSHSFLFFTEILSAFVGLLVFMQLRDRSTSTWRASACGAAAGYLLLLHARNVGLVAGLILVAIHRRRHWAHGNPLALPSFLAAVAAMVALRTALTFDMWGTWVTTPQARVDFAAPLIREGAMRLAGWLFDQEHGLLLYAPIYLLVPAGLLTLWRVERDLCVDLLIVVVVYVGVMTVPALNAHGWRGGWSPAGRFLLPIMPLLAIAAFAAVGQRRRLPAVAIALALIQIAIDGVLWQSPKLLWNGGGGTSALLQYLDRGTGRLSAYAPSVLDPIAGRTIVTIAAILAVWALLTLQLRLRPAAAASGREP